MQFSRPLDVIGGGMPSAKLRLCDNASSANKLFVSFVCFVVNFHRLTCKKNAKIWKSAHR